jgi:hypothetical protein
MANSSWVQHAPSKTPSSTATTVTRPSWYWLSHSCPFTRIAVDRNGKPIRTTIHLWMETNPHDGLPYTLYYCPADQLDQTSEAGLHIRDLYVLINPIYHLKGANPSTAFVIGLIGESITVLCLEATSVKDSLDVVNDLNAMIIHSVSQSFSHAANVKATANVHAEGENKERNRREALISKPSNSTNSGINDGVVGRMAWTSLGSGWHVTIEGRKLLDRLRHSAVTILGVPLTSWTHSSENIVECRIEHSNVRYRIVFPIDFPISMARLDIKTNTPPHTTATTAATMAMGGNAMKSQVIQFPWVRYGVDEVVTKFLTYAQLLIDRHALQSTAASTTVPVVAAAIAALNQLNEERSAPQTDTKTHIGENTGPIPTMPSSTPIQSASASSNDPTAADMLAGYRFTGYVRRIGGGVETFQVVIKYDNNGSLILTIPNKQTRIALTSITQILLGKDPAGRRHPMSADPELCFTMKTNTKQSYALMASTKEERTTFLATVGLWFDHPDRRADTDRTNAAPKSKPAPADAVDEAASLATGKSESLFTAKALQEGALSVKASPSVLVGIAQK